VHGDAGVCTVGRNPGDRRDRAGYRAGVPSTEHLLAFLLAGVVLVAIPGPSVLFIVGRALAHGRRAALTSVAGNTTGVVLIVLAVALGIGTVAAASAAVFSVLKLAGAAYLAYLGVQTWRHRGDLAVVLGGAGAAPGRRVFWQGVVVGATNPKVLVLFVALLPQFTDPGAGRPATQMLVLGLLFTAIAATLDSVWGLAAGAARDWFANSPTRLRRVGGAGGLMMIGLGATLALTGRRD
jgi:threonine/homoserine/homoserine lactone efflux protein